jgi:formylglycine-generating enzyme required for sulfatase activity
MLLTVSCLGCLAYLGPSPAALSAQPPAKLKSKTIKLHQAGRFTTAVSFEMVQLPPGKITLKDDKGKETEYQIKPIWIAKTETTWEPYDVFWMRLDAESPWDRKVDAQSRPSKPYFPPDRGWGHEGSPAMALTRQSAELYCQWLSKNTGKKFRIPTDAEWEYACRAGGPPVKLDAKELDKLAWFSGNSKDQTHPVAKKAPNAWGLYDMLGNVAEHVTTNTGKYPKGIVAGGSYQDEAADVGSAAREAYKRSWQRSDPQEPLGRSWLSDGLHVGLRVVMEE